MDADLIRRHFARIGADLRVEAFKEIRTRSGIVRTTSDYQLDIREKQRSESFILSIREEAVNAYDFLAVDVQPKDRHLLLMARRLDSGENRKFLCGHDERHWFVAGVNRQAGVTGVRQAMEALKPNLATWSQIQNGVKPKNQNRRHNNGFIRQGEWFFIPRPSFKPENPRLILRHEPLQRGAGKPHTTEELYRIGGETVYVCSHYPSGVTQSRYTELIAKQRGAKGWNWRVMRRNPTVYVRGTVRHLDHQTITLPFWHQVVLSNEWNDGTVAFLD